MSARGQLCDVQLPHKRRVASSSSTLRMYARDGRAVYGSVRMEVAGDMRLPILAPCSRRSGGRKCAASPLAMRVCGSSLIAETKR